MTTSTPSVFFSDAGDAPVITQQILDEVHAHRADPSAPRGFVDFYVVKDEHVSTNWNEEWECTFTDGNDNFWQYRYTKMRGKGERIDTPVDISAVKRVRAKLVTVYVPFDQAE